MLFYIALFIAIILVVSMRKYGNRSTMRIKNYEKSKAKTMQDLKESMVQHGNLSEMPVAEMISHLKASDASLFQAVFFLKENTDLNVGEAKQAISDSGHWNEECEASETLTQEFANGWAQKSDKVEYGENGNVIAVIVDLTKDDTKKK